MPSLVLPPNPSLVAILLIVQSRSGPGRLVFHYPPDPSREGSSISNVNEDGEPSDADTSSSDTNADSSTDEDDLHQGKRKFDPRSLRGVRHATPKMVDVTEDEDQEITSTGLGEQKDTEWRPAYEPLLGLGTAGLVALLTPSTRIWHKRKFEVGLNDLVFLGWPVFVREDGTWKKRKTKANERRKPHGTRGGGDGDSNKTSIPTKYQRDGEAAEPEEDQPKAETPLQAPSSSDEMTMFNIVFVLNPPILDYTLRTREMYDHVVKKFGRALKWEQARSNYVWTETELIQSVKSKYVAQHAPASAMYHEVLSRSSLANAISLVHNAISTSRIASVTLSPYVALSLQIPPVISTSVLPSATDPPSQSGLWLTTANDPPGSTSDIEPAFTAASSSSHFAKHFGLLLLDNPLKILKDVSAAGGSRAAMLATFVNAAKPTKSFHKVSLASSISVTDVQHLARHLIYWRRAIAILPLNQSDTYIVSPNADLRKLTKACTAFELAFPTLPGLGQMLSALSGTPKPWSSFIPSNDHKEVYYQMLAWMLRGGWVTQLRTFAYVRVPPKVKEAVQVKDLKKGRNAKDSPNVKEHGNNEDGTPYLSGPRISGQANNKNSRPLSYESDERMASLILHPHRASPLESKWLDHIGGMFLASNDGDTNSSEAERLELKKHWTAFTKYFNGTEALEKIPVREGLKRKQVWDLLRKMGLSFEPRLAEGEDDDRKLVVFRHW